MSLQGAAPLTARQEEKREAIVRIAQEVFLSEGYSAASMATVAARLGGSKGTLYNYFKSKEELFGAVVQDFCGRNALVFQGFNFDDGDFRAGLTRFGGQVIRLMLSDDVIAMHRLIAAEAARFPEIGEAYYAAGVKKGKERLLERFREAMDAGFIRRADPLVAAQHFFDLCLSGLHRHRLWNIGPRPTEAQMDSNVENAVTTFLQGYRVSEKE